MKTKILIKITCLLFVISTTNACLDLASVVSAVDDTEYFELSAENLYEPDSLNTNSVIWDSIAVKNILEEPTVNTILTIKEFDVLVPVRYAVFENNNGTFNLPIGKARIDNKQPGFFRFEVSDNYVPHELIGLNMASFFYIPSDGLPLITIEDEIANAQGATIFYKDANSIIYGSQMEYTVVHIKHLKAQNLYEVFRSDQKSNPFMELSEQDLYAMALSKLQLAKNFHATKDNPKEQNWENFNGLISRYQKKLYTTLHNAILELNNEIPTEKAMLFELDEYNLEALVIRDSTAQVLFEELSLAPLNTEIDIKKDSLQPEAKSVLDRILLSNDFEITKSGGNAFVLKEGSSHHIIYYNEKLEVPYLICISPDVLGLRTKSETDFYFELLTRLNTLKIQY